MIFVAIDDGYLLVRLNLDDIGDIQEALNILVGNLGYFGQTDQAEKDMYNRGDAMLKFLEEYRTQVTQ